MRVLCWEYEVRDEGVRYGHVLGLLDGHGC